MTDAGGNFDGEAMRVAVMGAGAVGCYFGARLAQAGIPVTLIGRSAHVEAVRAHGLCLETATGRSVVPVAATTEAAGVVGADVVLVCVKSDDTERAGREIAPHLKPGAAILSLQNGVDNAERLSAVLGRGAVPVAVYVATEMPGPGHVRLHGRGDLVIGASPASRAIAARFTAAGVPTVVSEDALAALWGKLIVNCAYNALSALAQRPYGDLLATPGIAETMADIVAECRAVADASGVSVADDILSTVLGLAAAMPDQFSSTAQALARGRPSEIDHLNGHILRRGAELGVPTPVNRVLHTLVKLAEAKAR